MKGRNRSFKKQIVDLGLVLYDRGKVGDAYRLVLQGPGGSELTVDAPTRPMAYRRAARLATSIAPEVGLRPSR